MNNARPNRLPTIDGETLMSKPLQPLNFVVDTLISQGLHILAGSPKVGKSWLALWLAVTVAKGESVWGLPVKQGRVRTLAGHDALPLPGGLPAAHPEPAVRCDGGRAAQRVLLHREPHPGGWAGGTAAAIPGGASGHIAGHHRLVP